MRVLGGLEWLTLEKPFIGALHTNSYSLLNGHGYGRMTENYRMLSEKDALAWCECAGHILGPVHQDMIVGLFSGCFKVLFVGGGSWKT